MSHELPQLLREVAEIAGLDAAIKIARGLGKKRMYIPHRLTSGHRLARCVGPKAAALICAHFAGDTVVWPEAGKYLRQLDTLIRWHEGWSAERIARDLGVHQRTVWRIVSGVDRDAALVGVPAVSGLHDPESCPACGRRYHRRIVSKIDPRQMPLPLPASD